jgi:hypothetical protein
MIRVHPSINFFSCCPSDGSTLQLKSSVIPNLHCLAEAVCPTCKNQYYVDLPVGQALWSPVILNRETAEVYEPLGRKWFSKPLQDSFLNQEKSDIVPIVQKFYDSDRIIIINCLDYLYGHSLLKLLNVQRYLDHSPELGCCVLVPTQLKHLVPEGVAEIWEFPVPIKNGTKWYPSLAKWINEQMASRKECFLSKAYSHPSNQVYDLSRFVKELPDISDEVDGCKPVVLFSYREDRCWGGKLVKQQRNLQSLYDRLSKVFPEMLFVLVGFGTQNKIYQSGAKIIDLRADKFDVDRDRLWMAYMKAADCAFGVHGSNMLLPSGLAKSTVELVYTSRIENTVQDFLFHSKCQDIRDVLLYYRMLYGDDSLSDIYPSTVCNVIIGCLSYSKINSSWFKVGEQATTFQADQYSSGLYSQVHQYFKAKGKKTLVTGAVRKLAKLVLASTD